MTQWTSIEQALPGDWDQGTRYLKSEFSFWMSVAEPPVEVSELDTLLLAS